MLSLKALISLSQFLELQSSEDTCLLLMKCGLVVSSRGVRGAPAILERLQASSHPHIREVIQEVCRTSRNLRNKVNPKYLYDERWNELCRCLLLDGYRVTGDYSSGYDIVALDPTIEAVRPLDDDLTMELSRSTLRDRFEVIRLMKNSSEDFCKQPQDFNGSLTSARVALETLTKNIGEAVGQSISMPGDPTKFGANIAYLRSQVQFLSQEEEKGIAGVYAFVSPGAHTPVGLTEEEMVRLGRTMIAAMCYFLIKRYNGWLF